MFLAFKKVTLSPAPQILKTQSILEKSFSFFAIFSQQKIFFRKNAKKFLCFFYQKKLKHYIKIKKTKVCFKKKSPKLNFLKYDLINTKK